MPNLYDEKSKSGVNELLKVGNYSLVEWFKHEGYEPEYVLVSNFKVDKDNGTCEWDHGSYAVDYISGKRLFRDKIFELEDLHDIKLESDFNIWVDGKVNEPLGDNARRIEEFPYLYELMDLRGIKFANKLEYIGNLSSNPELRFISHTAGQDVIVSLPNVKSVDDFIEAFNQYAIEYDVDEEVRLYLNAKVGGFQGVPEAPELTRDCEEVKQTLMDFANDLLRWKNLDCVENLHNEYKKAVYFNETAKSAFSSLEDRDKFIKDNKGKILKDLPLVNSRISRATEAMKEAREAARGKSGQEMAKEAKEVAKGGSGKSAGRDLEER